MKRPSSWVNLQDFLGVNADQAEGMGQKVAGSVEAQARGAQDAIHKASAASGANPYSQAHGGMSSSFGPGGKLQTDTGFAGQQSGGGAYSGQQSLSDTDPGITKQVGDAVARVKGAGGAESMEQTFGANPSAGAGGSAMDSFLLSQSGAMQGLQEQYGDLNKQFENANDSVKANAAQQQEVAKAGNAQRAADDAARNTHQGEQTALKDARHVRVPRASQKNDAAMWSRLNGTDPGEEANKYADFINAQQKDVGDDLRSVVRDLSPIDHLWQSATGGKKSYLDEQFSNLNSNVHGSGSVSFDKNKGSYGAQHGGRGQGGGNESGGIGEHIPWGANDYVVFRQMDDAQWKQLQSMGQDGQKAWLEKRRLELAPSWRSPIHGFISEDGVLQGSGS